ncbi:Excinuclease ABC subunit C [Caenispirillum salinarum AK4]|uniref:UvrABC system protein C n=2 Tax=Caenispirillum TaxID=414051 RepID=K9H237_9PROT|nr:Excinuclease ABC subunit C [Caenispirillum salinarum AK4]
MTKIAVMSAPETDQKTAATPETEPAADIRVVDADLAPDEAPDAVSRGVAVISRTLKTLPDKPGVYRMMNAKGDVLYVGKAKNLKKRVVAYTRIAQLPMRLQRMVTETAAMEIVVTSTEVEALLLESNYIKRLKPRYNILLRDDKSFPYVVVTEGHDYPRIIKHRGARSIPGQYFGPFASAGAVNQTLTHLQKAFLLRTCSDSVFSSRTRPCLLYQIKRCAAPCVDRISREHYGELVEESRAFLAGESARIQQALAKRMEAASENLEFEEAAMYRDRIRALTRIQSHQEVNLPSAPDADVMAIHQAGGQACIEVFFFRAGQNYGNRAYFPAHSQDAEPGEVLEAFIGQFYDNKEPPKEVLLSHDLPQAPLMAEALSAKAERKVRLHVPKRGDRAAMVVTARRNAEEALGRRLAESSAQRKLLDGVAEVFDMERTPERIEVYDNSHIQGSNAIGGMIVAGPEGFMKNSYRKFNIKNAEAAGDDYAMMREVLTRRFARAMKEDPDRDRGQWPDVVLIDGGQGQLKVVQEVFDDLGVEDVTLVSIAKGPDRDAGRERFFMTGREPFQLPMRHPVLYFLQRLRDEAHRFAIGTHRARRSKDITRTGLEDVPGIGARRKKALLHHFGSARGVREAALRDLESVEGISAALARKIYDHFHPEG